MTPMGFEPTISAGERSQTYALDRAAKKYDNIQIKIQKYKYFCVYWSDVGFSSLKLSGWTEGVECGVEGKREDVSTF